MRIGRRSIGTEGSTETKRLYLVLWVIPKSMVMMLAEIQIKGS